MIGLIGGVGTVGSIGGGPKASGGVSAPNAPTNFVATASTTVSGQVDLTWTDASNETSYSLEQSPDGVGSWAVIATPAGNATSATVSSLTPGTTYYFRLRSYDSVTTLYSSYATANATVSLNAAPLLVGGSPRVWYAADRTGSTYADNDTVTSVVNLGTATANLGADSGTPKYKTGIFAGGTKPSLFFDGVDDSLKTASLDLQQTNDNFTVFVLWKPATQVDTYGRPFGCRYEGVGPGFEFDAASQDFSCVWNPGFSGYNNPKGTATANTIQFMHYVKSGTTATIYKDGTQQATNASVSATINDGTTATGFHLGTSSGDAKFAKMDLAEIIWYCRALSAGEITTIKGYFTTKYGVTIA